jgi:hypothetical protein
VTDRVDQGRVDARDRSQCIKVKAQPLSPLGLLIEDLRVLRVDVLNGPFLLSVRLKRIALRGPRTLEHGLDVHKHEHWDRLRTVVRQLSKI